MPEQTVSAIICALDEAPRIGSVIRVLHDCALFEKVLVVDDGSTDDTAQVAAAAGAVVVSHAHNLGKARAMQTGLASTSAPVVCFIDADLLDITKEHLCALVEPVLSGEVPVALAVFKGGRAATTFAQKISPLISGQRCMRRELLDDFTAWDSKFGIETEISAHLQRKGITQLIVEWEGAAQVMKEEKRGPLKGFIARLGMYRDIVRSWLRNRS
jgi:glycosyltransferase involved in cell wall biosynthesis